MRVYLAGPMNGIPEYNVPLFHKVEAKLLALGWDVLSPARDYENYQHEGSDPETSIDTPQAHMAYLRRDILMLLDVEGIVLLPGWDQSSGANIELVVARAFGLSVWDWDEDRKIPVISWAIPNRTRLELVMVSRAEATMHAEFPH